MADGHPRDHPLFRLVGYPDGIISLSVCWDQIDVREIAASLRDVAKSLDALPEDAHARGVMPL